MERKTRTVNELLLFPPGYTFISHTTEGSTWVVLGGWRALCTSHPEWGIEDLDYFDGDEITVIGRQMES